MYEQLVRDLRNWSKAWGEEPNPIGPVPVKRLAEAADAIEELSREYESIAKSLTESVELVRKLQSPRWVSVTERLPDAYEDVLLQFPNNQAAGFCDRDGCWGVYSGDGFYTEVADNEPKPTHWAKKLPEPPKEEET